MKIGGSASDHLANERTFLAYIRTALAFIGFGFVSARFAVFMREFSQIAHNRLPSGHGVSDSLGVAMVVMGIAVGCFGAYRYSAQLRAITDGRPNPLSIPAAVATAVGIALFGGLLAVVLFRL